MCIKLPEDWYKFDMYKKLWSVLGSRPWTYIYRDIYRKYEWFIQMQWFWTAYLAIWLIAGTAPLKSCLILCAVYTFGYINGHFFWGGKIIEGQTETTEQATITRLQAAHNRKWKKYSWSDTGKPRLFTDCT